MYCHQCGAQLASDAKFCAQCGAKVVPAAPTAPVVEIVAAEPSPLPPVQPRPEIEFPAPLAVPKPTPKAVSPPDSATKALPRASSIQGAMTNSQSTEAATLGCVIAAVGTLIFVPTPLSSRLIAVGIYLSIAFGIWKMSRIAAIAGLLLAGANILLVVVVAVTDPAEIQASRVAPIVIFTGLWIKFLFQAVLETFAYHRARSTR